MCSNEVLLWVLLPLVKAEDCKTSWNIMKQNRISNWKYITWKKMIFCSTVQKEIEVIHIAWTPRRFKMTWADFAQSLPLCFFCSPPEMGGTEWLSCQHRPPAYSCGHDLFVEYPQVTPDYCWAINASQQTCPELLHSFIKFFYLMESVLGRTILLLYKYQHIYDIYMYL